MLPLEFDSLIEIIKKIPSISNKQAHKIAKFIINQDKTNIEKQWNLFFQNLLKINKCSICSYYTTEKLCNICLSPNRENKIMIIENIDQIQKYEDWKIYQGKYYLAPILFNEKLIYIQDNNFDSESFVNYVNQFDEIIIGISPHQQGILTINYLLDILKKKNILIKVSQLAIGIPFGASMDYIDQLTMSYAIKNRKDIE